MSQTFIVKGSHTSASATLSATTVGNAQFVRVTATAGANTITVADADSNTLGTAYIHTAGDSIIIEKAPTDKLSSSGNAVAAAVGSPRS